ncbi:unnamed protein product [Cuscuta epithymum]|uniref:Uncharacterized protein n=1 Tax=Cuscuta epithymum TaxID=186058 RepID=A0AAV0BZG5_9ASTE|nr:unnamed protein product [Cuscuta epithymum]
METQMISSASLLEALAFTNPSYGFLTAVKSIWAWAAVLTVFMGLWKIKSSPKSPNGSLELPDPPRNVALSPPWPVARLPAEPPPPGTGLCTVGLTKGKFTAYFDGEEESDDGGIDDGIYTCKGKRGDGVVLARGLGDEWYESWQRALKTKTGGAGWYCNQDLTVINGNVVRLWGSGCRRRRAAACVGVGCVASW